MIAASPDRTAMIAGGGIIGGIIGGVLIDAFLSIVNHQSVIGIWQFVASAVVGPVAFTSVSYAGLGFAMHFIISIAWASIFAALALTRLPWLIRRPVAGGIAYGIVVMIAMTVLLAIKHVGPPGPPPVAMLVTSLVAHTLFFGVPVALFVASVARRHSATA